jgi:hypothetical protein
LNVLAFSASGSVTVSAMTYAEAPRADAVGAALHHNVDAARADVNTHSSSSWPTRGTNTTNTKTPSTSYFAAKTGIVLGHVLKSTLFGGKELSTA